MSPSEKRILENSSPKNNLLSLFIRIDIFNTFKSLISSNFQGWTIRHPNLLIDFVDKEVTYQGLTLLVSLKSLPEKHSVPYLKLIEDTKKYKKDQLYFLENPKLLYNPDFYYEGFPFYDRKHLKFEDEGLSIGIFQSASSTDASPENVFSMYVARTRHVTIEYPDFHQRTYNPDEASRISYFCGRVLSLGLTNLEILVLHQILVNRDMFQSIGCLKLEQLSLISCWWDLGGFSHDPQKALFKRLHIIQYYKAFITLGSLLHENLEELIIDSHVPSYNPFNQCTLHASKCGKLRHM